MIRLDSICKSYNTRPPTEVLHNINLTIKQGEFIAIMGPSGSGKSTLLNIIGFLDSHDRGRYFYNGQTVAGLNDNQLARIRSTQIGFVFQNFNLIPRETVLRNVELPLTYQGIPKLARQQAALKAVTQLGLADKTKHLPNQLSGGQQQRVAIARAIVTKPDVLIADEPTGNLDSATSRDIMSALCALNKAGKTLVMVTHDPQIAAYANRVVRVLDGSIQECA